MGDIHLLPGVVRLDIEEATSPQAVLQSALDSGLAAVAIVGRGIDGEILVWGSMTDADTAAGFLMRGASWLLNASQVSAIDPKDGA